MKIKERLTNKDAWIRYRDSLRYALHCIVRPFDGFWGRLFVQNHKTSVWGRICNEVTFERILYGLEEMTAS